MRSMAGFLIWSTFKQREEIVQTTNPLHGAFHCCSPGWIDQYGSQSSLLRPKHIPPRIIPDKHRVTRADAKLLQRNFKYVRVWLPLPAVGTKHHGIRRDPM